MPIRPENKARYPADWKEISLSIRQHRAQWRCEQMDANGELGRCTAMHGEPHPITGGRVVLTVAHLDHQPENCAPDNLKAMCQRCHNRYDMAERRRGIRERERAALGVPDMLEQPHA